MLDGERKFGLRQPRRGARHDQLLQLENAGDQLELHHLRLAPHDVHNLVHRLVADDLCAERVLTCRYVGQREVPIQIRQGPDSGPHEVDLRGLHRVSCADVRNFPSHCADLGPGRHGSGQQAEQHARQP